MLSICGFECKATLVLRIVFFLSRILLFWSTHSNLFVAPYSIVFEVLVQIHRLRVTILHHLPAPFLFLTNVCTPEFSAQFSLSFRSSGMRFFQVLLHFFKKCSSLVFLLFFMEFLYCVTSMLLSLSSCLSSIAAISSVLYNSDSLLTLSLQLLFQVCVFSFKADPNASVSREISFHLSLGFELFHLSCELCPASSPADDRQ